MDAETLFDRIRRERAELIEIGIARALRRGLGTAVIPDGCGGVLVFDLSTWPQIRSRLLEQAH